MFIFFLKLLLRRFINNFNYKGKYMVQYDLGNVEDSDFIDSFQGVCSFFRVQNFFVIGIYRKG